MMADFDDITGWEEELAAFEATEEGKAHFERSQLLPGKTIRTNKPIPKLPLSYLMELSALMMENRTLKEALDQEYAWHELLEEVDARGEEMTEQHPENYRMPRSAIRALTSFQRWYSMKKP